MVSSDRRAALSAAAVPFCLWFGYVALEAVFGRRLAGAALARQALMVPACGLLSFLAWRLGRVGDKPFPLPAFAAATAAATALEQAIKAAVAAGPRARLPLPGGWLAFVPTLNTHGAWLASRWDLSLPMVGLAAVNVLSIPILMYSYLRMRETVSRTPAAHAAFVFLMAGAVCSLLDKLLCGGSLDYIAVLPLFVCDLKDIYLCVGVCLAAAEYLRTRGGPDRSLTLYGLRRKVPCGRSPRPMKRSEINAIMEDAVRFLDRMGFRLPPFASWKPDDWKGKGEECREIARSALGWDITDFGGGDFARQGLFLFTIRNGVPAGPSGEGGKTYAEKIMIVREEQVTPTHFHFSKMEDIINRGGGELVVQLWNSTPEERLAGTPVEVSLDGVRTAVKAGGTVSLRPGESICLPPRLYHKFWGARGKGTVLVGEVSRVNDDNADNRFLDPVGRFPRIQEDEAPLHLLCGDYGTYYRFA